MLTGVAMFSAMRIGEIVSLLASAQLPPNSGWTYALALLPIVSLIVMFRLFPLSGYHAAEHQVVHAIEQDEPLLPDVVRRMPRVHPRCGTNIGVGVSMFLGISQTPWIPWDDVRLLVAVILTLFLWRPVGGFVQQYVTTKPATPKQIQSGIDAANELLLKFESASKRQATPWTRLLNSGVFHVIGGAVLAYVIVSLLAMPLGIKFFSS